jgi:hypothetical protein
MEADCIERLFIILSGNDWEEYGDTLEALPCKD